LEIAQGPKGGASVGPNDDVVKNLNLEQLAGPDEIAGDLDVCLRGHAFSRRMVVHQHDRRGSCDDGCSKDFPWMHKEGVECARADHYMPFDSPSGVEEKHNETLGVGVKSRMMHNMCSPIVGGSIWLIA